MLWLAAMSLEMLKAYYFFDADGKPASGEESNAVSTISSPAADESFSKYAES